jgi:hypothetical protein
MPASYHSSLVEGQWFFNNLLGMGVHKYRFHETQKAIPVTPGPDLIARQLFRKIVKPYRENGKPNVVVQQQSRRVPLKFRQGWKCVASAHEIKPRFSNYAFLLIVCV